MISNTSILCIQSPTKLLGLLLANYSIFPSLFVFHLHFSRPHRPFIHEFQQSGVGDASADAGLGQEPWENHEKIMENWENHGEIMGNGHDSVLKLAKSWENHGKMHEDAISMER